MKTTDDCREWLAAYFANNQTGRDWITYMFTNPSTPTAELDNIRVMMRTPKNWKRIYKCKPGNNEYSEYDVKKNPQKYQNFVAERGFVCHDKSLDYDEDMIKFILYEDKFGELSLGEYIGD